MIVWLVGIIGSLYALFGGLRTVAVSDLLNGIGLLAGGLMITWFGLKALGDGSLVEGLAALARGNEGRFNSIGGADSSVPIGTVFSGVLLLQPVLLDHEPADHPADLRRQLTGGGTERRARHRVSQAASARCTW